MGGHVRVMPISPGRGRLESGFPTRRYRSDNQILAPSSSFYKPSCSISNRVSLDRQGSCRADMAEPVRRPYLLGGVVGRPSPVAVGRGTAVLLHSLLPTDRDPAILVARA